MPLPESPSTDSRSQITKESSLEAKKNEEDNHRSMRLLFVCGINERSILSRKTRLGIGSHTGLQPGRSSTQGSSFPESRSGRKPSDLEQFFYVWGQCVS